MTKKFSITFLTTAIFCLLLAIGNVFAQSQASTGQITGVVTDATGAVVPNATVTIISKATNATQSVTTSDDGIYRFVLLQPGNYTVKAVSSGFGEQTLDVETQVGRTTDANFTLGAGNVSATVEVT
ncbi:MAG TPA: carboxypeptidase-like regulatory domain-containing protein, partial [Pyrinomonadaceae bacterium]|nr:carboxypeptidase-like regulatory domain-containing protein [Pyrinomonadaceae bacterium]